MNKLERIKELSALVNKYAYHYYVLDNPLVADVDYDRLYDELESLEKETGIVLDDSPTLRVGGEVLEGFIKHRHEVPLFSLDKVRSVEELEKWINDMRKEVKNADFSLEYKFDGLTICCEYENGKYIRATTRGNGSIGEDVTAQVRTIKSVPLTIDYKGRLIVQGEGMMTLTSLEKYNKSAKEPLKNARNGVAGAIRNLDPKETARRNLDFFAYSILLCDKEFLSQNEIHEFLKEQGFQTGDYFKIVSDIEYIESEINRINEIKNTLNIMMDGLVLKLNSIKERDDIGYTAKFPKWAIAYKFEAQEATSILLDCIWQVGRTGKITPIGIIKPIELAGATIKRATLNNYEDIKRKKVEIGSSVFIRRSNEVIPEILGIAERHEGSKKIDAPKFCPSCGSKLVTKGPLLFCLNRNDCKEQVINRLAHFTSREAMDIRGLSDKTCQAFYENLNVRSILDLYSLTYDEIKGLEGFEDKKARNIIESIERSKNVEFSRFLYAIGIPEVGKKTANILAKKYKDLEELKNTTSEELESIYDLGELTAKYIYDFMHNQEFMNEIDKLVKIINIKNTKKKINNNTFFNNSKVVLTGSLETLTRLKATEILEGFGASITNTVSKNTDYVIVGKDPGSKFIKANTLGIKILNEEEFLKIIANKN